MNDSNILARCLAVFLGRYWIAQLREEPKLENRDRQPFTMIRGPGLVPHASGLGVVIGALV